MTRPTGRIWSRLLATLLSLSFLLPSLAWAFDPTTFAAQTRGPFFQKQPVVIPPALGQVTRFHQGQERLVVYIQDLHCNLEVQKNIAGVIDYLAQTHQLTLVGVEGAEGQVDVSKLASFPDRAVREQVGDYFVQAGKITGPEYCAAVRNPKIRVAGVECLADYQANAACVRQFLNEESQGLICDLREALEGLKPALYSAALQAHDRHRWDFQAGKVSLLQYSAYLAKALAADGSGLERFPRLTALVSRRAQLFPGAVDSDQLHAELEQAEAVLRERRYSHAQERELDEWLRRLQIMERLLNISATPQEVAEYRQHPIRFGTRAILDFIGRYDPASQEEAAETLRLDEYLEQTREFYRLADSRSQSLVDNLLSRMAAHNTAIGVLIAGGFHSDGIFEQLRGRGVTCLMVKPRLDAIDLVNPYFQLLQGRRTPLEKLLAQNQNILSLPTNYPTTSLPHTEAVATFLKQLDLTLKHALAAAAAAGGKLTLAQLEAACQETLARYPENHPGIAIDWKVARAHEHAGVYLLPFNGLGVTAWVRPATGWRRVAARLAPSMQIKNYEVTLLDADEAEAHAAAYLQPAADRRLRARVSEWARALAQPLAVLAGGEDQAWTAASILYPHYLRSLAEAPQGWRERWLARLGEPVIGAPLWEWIFALPSLTLLAMGGDGYAAASLLVTTSAGFSFLHPAQAAGVRAYLFSLGLLAGAASLLPSLALGASVVSILAGVASHVILHASANLLQWSRLPGYAEHAGLAVLAVIALGGSLGLMTTMIAGMLAPAWGPAASLAAAYFMLTTAFASPALTAVLDTLDQVENRGIKHALIRKLLAQSEQLPAPMLDRLWTMAVQAYRQSGEPEARPALAAVLEQASRARGTRAMLQTAREELTALIPQLQPSPTDPARARSLEAQTASFFRILENISHTRPDLFDPLLLALHALEREARDPGLRVRLGELIDLAFRKNANVAATAAENRARLDPPRMREAWLEGFARVRSGRHLGRLPTWGGDDPAPAAAAALEIMLELPAGEQRLFANFLIRALREEGSDASREVAAALAQRLLDYLAAQRGREWQAANGLLILAEGLLEVTPLAPQALEALEARLWMLLDHGYALPRPTVAARELLPAVDLAGEFFVDAPEGNGAYYFADDYLQMLSKINNRELRNHLQGIYDDKYALANLARRGYAALLRGEAAAALGETMIARLREEARPQVVANLAELLRASPVRGAMAALLAERYAGAADAPLQETIEGFFQAHPQTLTDLPPARRKRMFENLRAFLQSWMPGLNQRIAAQPAEALAASDQADLRLLDTRAALLKQLAGVDPGPREFLLAIATEENWHPFIRAPFCGWWSDQLGRHPQAQLAEVVAYTEPAANAAALRNELQAPFAEVNDALALLAGKVVPLRERTGLAVIKTFVDRPVWLEAVAAHSEIPMALRLFAFVKRLALAEASSRAWMARWQQIIPAADLAGYLRTTLAENRACRDLAFDPWFANEAAQVMITAVWLDVLANHPGQPIEACARHAALVGQAALHPGFTDLSSVYEIGGSTLAALEYSTPLLFLALTHEYAHNLLHLEYHLPLNGLLNSALDEGFADTMAKAFAVRYGADVAAFERIMAYPQHLAAAAAAGYQGRSEHALARAQDAILRQGFQQHAQRLDATRMAEVQLAFFKEYKQWMETGLGLWLTNLKLSRTFPEIVAKLVLTYFNHPETAVAWREWEDGPDPAARPFHLPLLSPLVLDDILRKVLEKPGAIFYRYYLQAKDVAPSPRWASWRARLGEPLLGAPAWEWVFSIPVLAVLSLGASWAASFGLLLASAAVFSLLHPSRAWSSRLGFLGLGLVLAGAASLPLLALGPSLTSLATGVAVNALMHSLVNFMRTQPWRAQPRVFLRMLQAAGAAGVAAGLALLLGSIAAGPWLAAAAAPVAIAGLAFMLSPQIAGQGVQALQNRLVSAFAIRSRPGKPHAPPHAAAAPSAAASRQAAENFLSPKRVQYLLDLFETIRVPQVRTRLVALGGGADISSTLLATDAEELVFLNFTRRHSAFTPEEKEKIKPYYRSNKQHNTYMPSTILNNLGLEEAIRLELEATGATAISEFRDLDDSGLHFEVSFDWTHPITGKTSRRTLRTYHADAFRPSAYPEVLQRDLEAARIDYYMVKGLDPRLSQEQGAESLETFFGDRMAAPSVAFSDRDLELQERHPAMLPQGMLRRTEPVETLASHRMSVGHHVSFKQAPEGVYLYIRGPDQAEPDVAAAGIAPAAEGPWDWYAPWMPRSLRPLAEEVLFRGVPWLATAGFQITTLAVQGGLIVAGAIAFLASHWRKDWSVGQWLAAMLATLAITAAFYSPAFWLADSSSGVLPWTTDLARWALAGFLGLAAGSAIHYLSNLLSRFTQGRWPELVADGEPAKKEVKIPQRQSGERHAAKQLEDYGPARVMHLAVGGLDGYRELRTLYGPGIVDFLRDKMLQELQRILGAKAKVFALNDNQFAVFFSGPEAAGTGDLLSAMNRLAGEFRNAYCVNHFPHYQQIWTEVNQKDRQQLAAIAQRHGGMVDFNAPRGQMLMVLPTGRASAVEKEMMAAGLADPLNGLFPNFAIGTRVVNNSKLWVPSLSFGLVSTDFIQQRMKERQPQQQGMGPKAMLSQMMWWASLHWQEAAKLGHRVVAEAVDLANQVALQYPDADLEKLRAAVPTDSLLELPPPAGVKDPQQAAIGAITALEELWTAVEYRRILELATQSEGEQREASRELLKLIRSYGLKLQPIPDFDLKTLALILGKIRRLVEDKQVVHGGPAARVLYQMTSRWENKFNDPRKQKFYKKHPDIAQALIANFKPEQRRRELAELQKRLRRFCQGQPGVVLSRGRVKDDHSVYENIIAGWSRFFSVPKNPKDFQPEDFSEANLMRMLQDPVGVTLQVVPRDGIPDVDKLLTSLIAYLESLGYLVAEVKGKNVQITRDPVHVEFLSENAFTDVKLVLGKSAQLAMGGEVQIFASELAPLLDVVTRPSYVLTKRKILKDINWVITIDGPEGKTKYDAAELLAIDSDYRVLDIGYTFRAMVYALRLAGVSLHKPEAVRAALPNIHIKLHRNRFLIANRDITDHLKFVDPKDVVQVAHYPEVQAFIRDKIQAEVRKKRVVVVGRQPSTWVPEADVKFYLNPDQESNEIPPDDAVTLYGATVEDAFSAMFGNLVETVMERGLAREVPRLFSIVSWPTLAAGIILGLAGLTTLLGGNPGYLASLLTAVAAWGVGAAAGFANLIYVFALDEEDLVEGSRWVTLRAWLKHGTRLAEARPDQTVLYYYPSLARPSGSWFVNLLRQALAAHEASHILHPGRFTELRALAAEVKSVLGLYRRARQANLVQRPRLMPALLGPEWQAQIIAQASAWLAATPVAGQAILTGQLFSSSRMFQTLLAELGIGWERLEPGSPLRAEFEQALEKLFRSLLAEPLLRNHTPADLASRLRILRRPSALGQRLEPERRLHALLQQGTLFLTMDGQTPRHLLVNPEQLDAIRSAFPEELPTLLEYFLLHEIVCAEEGHAAAIVKVDPVFQLRGWTYDAVATLAAHAQDIGNPWMQTVLRRSANPEKDQRLLLDFLKMDSDFKREIFSRLDRMSDQEILDYIQGRLASGQMGQPWNQSRSLGRPLQLDELFLHPTKGMKDLSQLIFNQYMVADPATVQRWTKNPERGQRFAEAVKDLYAAIRAIEILSRGSQPLLRESSSRDLSDYLREAQAAMETQGYSRTGAVRELAEGFMKLIGLIMPADTDSRKDSLTRFLEILRVLQEQDSAWAQELANPMHAARIAGLEQAQRAGQAGAAKGHSQILEEIQAVDQQLERMQGQFADVKTVEEAILSLAALPLHTREARAYAVGRVRPALRDPAYRFPYMPKEDYSGNQHALEMLAQAWQPDPVAPARYLNMTPRRFARMIARLVPHPDPHQAREIARFNAVLHAIPPAMEAIVADLRYPYLCGPSAQAIAEVLKTHGFPAVKKEIRFEHVPHYVVETTVAGERLFLDGTGNRMFDWDAPQIAPVVVPWREIAQDPVLSELYDERLMKESVAYLNLGTLSERGKVLIEKLKNALRAASQVRAREAVESPGQQEIEMSVRNAFLAGALWGGVFALFGWWQVAAVAAAVFGLQIGLIYKMYRAFQAELAAGERVPFRTWVWRTGGSTANTARGMRQEFLPYAGRLALLWFSLHEKVERFLPFRQIPLLNHLLASFTDVWTGALSAGLWGWNWNEGKRAAAAVPVAWHSLPAGRAFEIVRAFEQVLAAHRAARNDLSAADVEQAWSARLEKKTVLAAEAIRQQVARVQAEDLADLPAGQRRAFWDWLLLTLQYRYDPDFTFMHIWRVGVRMEEMAKVYHLVAGEPFEERPAETFRRLGWLHDIGKLLLPQDLLHQPKISPEETALIQSHARIGSMLAEAFGFADLAPAVGRHHELLNGRGYPFGLDASQLNEEIRALTVADSWDASTHRRPYRQAKTQKEFIAEMRADALRSDPRHDRDWITALAYSLDMPVRLLEDLVFQEPSSPTPTTPASGRLLWGKNVLAGAFLGLAAGLAAISLQQFDATIFAGLASGLAAGVVSHELLHKLWMPGSVVDWRRLAVTTRDGRPLTRAQALAGPLGSLLLGAVGALTLALLTPFASAALGLFLGFATVNGLAFIWGDAEAIWGKPGMAKKVFTEEELAAQAAYHAAEGLLPMEADASMNQPVRRPRTLASRLLGYGLKGILFDADVLRAGDPGSRLPLTGSVGFLRAAYLLTTVGFLLWMARPGRTTSLAGAASRAWLRDVQSDVAAEFFVKYGAGNFLAPGSLQPLSRLTFWQRLSHPLGKVVIAENRAPVFYIPDRLLEGHRPLLRWVLEYQLRNAENAIRLDLAAMRLSRPSRFLQGLAAAGLFLDASVTLSWILAKDRSLLAQALRRETAVRAAFMAWARDRQAANTQRLVLAMLEAAESGSPATVAANLETVSNLCRSLPGLPGVRMNRSRGQELALPLALWRPENYRVRLRWLERLQTWPGFGLRNRWERRRPATGFGRAA